MASIKKQLQQAEKKAKSSGLLPGLNANPPILDTSKLDKAISQLKKKGKK